MSIKLNPCKCGGKPAISIEEDQVNVFCKKCGIGYGMKNHYAAKPALIKYWNAANPIRKEESK